MSEEQEEGGSTMSAVKKAIIGAITTAVTAGGAWFATHLGGEEPKVETPAAVSAPAPVINITNSNENQQKQQAGGTNTVIIKEKAAPTAAESKPAKTEPKEEESPW